MKKIGSLLSLCLLGLGISQVTNAGEYYDCNAPQGCHLSSASLAVSTYDKTRYPIVLAHGMGGFTKAFGLIDYFHGVPETLMLNGTDNVFATKVDAVSSTEVRGEQLLHQVRQIQALSGQPKVNLIAHSHGGLDSRYVAAVAPKSVASVTTASSPHKGTKIADFVLAQAKKNADSQNLANGQNTLSTQTFYKLLEAIGTTEDVVSGVPLNKLQQQQSENGWKSISTKGVTAFNQKYPAPLPSTLCGKTPNNYHLNNIAYYSFAGDGHHTNWADGSDGFLAQTGKIFKNERNDGLVGSCSSRMGYLIRDNYNMNHLDTINQVLGLVDINETNPLSVYRAQVNRLKQAGY